MGSRLWVPVASGPLAPYAVDYGSWLAARGYSRWTVAPRLWQLDLLSRWLERERLEPGELTPECVKEFLVARRAVGYSSWLSERSTALPLEYLRELGVVPSVATVAVVDDRLERLLADYGRYLVDERLGCAGCRSGDEAAVSRGRCGVTSFCSDLASRLSHRLRPPRPRPLECRTGRT